MSTGDRRTRHESFDELVDRPERATPGVWRAVRAYLLGVGLVVAGPLLLGASIFGLSMMLVLRHDPLVASSSGEAVVTLSPGKHVIWHERAGWIDGKQVAEPPDAAPGRRVSVVSIVGPEARSPEIDTSVRGGPSMWFIQRSLIATFTADSAGEYWIRTTTSDARPAVVTVTSDPERTMAAFAAGLIVAVVLAVLTSLSGAAMLAWLVTRSVRRSLRAKRAIAK